MDKLKSVGLFIMMSIVWANTNAQTSWTFANTVPKGWDQVNYKSNTTTKTSWNLTTPDEPLAVFVRYQSANSEINTSELKYLQIKLMNKTLQNTARFYFRYENSFVYIKFDIDPESDYKTYTIDLANSEVYKNDLAIGKKWKYDSADDGTYKNMPVIRFDIPSKVPPANGYGVTSNSFNKEIGISSIKFLSSKD